ncbi:NAD(P) transhydrogenase subunit alpha [Salmonella enterica subsp. enterica serovar Enteritidis str. 22558]|nr:NAD(P) transhydrogenase subunit alpha [Salmonella enterica subsp. enterica serovar Enteritidis str. 22558]
MRIGIPKERLPNETRVAATPKTVEQLLKLGFSVAIESGAGQLASFDDKAFAQAGADIVDGNAIWQSEIILKVNAPEEEEIALLNPGTTLVSFIWPAQNPGLMEKLAERKVTVMAMDSVPRISRAQSLDALSSMANIAGYRAIVEAAHEFGRFLYRPNHCRRESAAGEGDGDWRGRCRSCGYRRGKQPGGDCPRV